MDNMVNAPGSGGMATGFDATSSVNGQNLGESQGYVWGGSAGDGFALMSQGGSGPGGFLAVSPNTDQPAQEGLDLGTDLSNDHPISVQYCGGGISGSQSATSTIAGGGSASYAAGTCNDRLFNLPTTAFVNGQSRFWVDTNVIPDADAIAAGAASIGGNTANPITRDPTTTEIYVTTGETISGGNNGDATGRGFIPSTTASSITKVPGFGVRTKQDIMLFTNNKGVTGPSVECASCHDPHTPNNGTFLRVSNNGSGLCLSCHVK
jgi:predicted CXXCH cytochrome family protein